MNQDDIDAAIGDLFFDVYNAVKNALDRVEKQQGVYICDRVDAQQELAQHTLDTIRRKIRAKIKEHD